MKTKLKTVETLQLKPCPFCGGKAQINDRDCYVYCATCFTEIDKFIYPDLNIELWNKRVKEQ